MTEIGGVPGYTTLIDDRPGEPARLRWLSIGPDGHVTRCTSDNNVAWSVDDEIWVQWRLVRDVYQAVDPEAPASDWAADMIPAGEHGMVIATRLDRPPNPVATGMLAALGIDRAVRGTVAWVGAVDPESGLHADLDDDQRATLVALATAGRTDGTRPR